METDNKNQNQQNLTKLRQPKEKKSLIEHLKKIPIVQISCERVGISRPTFYRWKADDQDFDKAVRDAISEGVTFINELSESQIITLIKEKKLEAVRFWLRHNHPKYAQRLEITTKEPQEKLNPEQEAMVKEALRLSGIATSEEKIATDNEQNKILINVQNNGDTNSGQQPNSDTSTAKSDTGKNPESTTKSATPTV